MAQGRDDLHFPIYVDEDIVPSFVQAQTAAFQRFERPQEEQLCEDESAALAAALIASERDEEERREAEVQREEERKRRRLQKQEEVARQLQREEEHQADQELAQALEASANEAQAHRAQQEWDDTLTQVQQKRQKERHAGIWDCLHCTFENAPYAPLCAACQAKPPPGTLVFEPIPDNLRFGLELELIITDGKRDGYTYEWMAQELSKLGPPQVEYRGYSHETSEHWKIVTDSSLRGRNHHDLCLELVSPVLAGSDGLNQLRIILEHVRQLGIATNRTCGFHVHVDATSTPLPALKRISQCFVALENAFDLLVAKNHRSADQNQYCRSNRIAFGRLSNKQRWDQIGTAHTTQQLVDWMNPDHDRYRKLNLTNLVNPTRPSTLEFRLHGGVEELREAEAWVRLVLRFCHRAPTCTVIGLPEEATPALELVELWKLIECPGLEQFYVLGRKLYVPPQQLRNQWRCRICRKPFGTSRALSQHGEATGHG